MLKSICGSWVLAETWVGFPESKWQLTIVCNFTSRRTDTVFGLLWAPGMQGKTFNKYKIEQVDLKTNFTK